MMVFCDTVTVSDRGCRGLTLSGNQLTGTIPEWLGSLTGFKYVVMLH